jgi:hypothetical protein
VFHWTAAVNGEDAYGNPVDADYNQDGMITMDEAFIYAETNDVQPEDPQYGDYPESIGEIITLWPGSDPPETPTKPDGPEQWIQNVETPFSSTTTDPEGESISYKFDWGDGNFSEWVGPYASGQTGEASHSWSELGEYEIKAIAKDINDIESNWSEPAVISIIENEPPVKVTIDGPSWGFGGKRYDFTFVSTDPEEHDLYYRVDWDDGHETGWIGPYGSGETITLNHTWKNKGDYLIKAWAKDILKGKSQQTNFKLNILTNASMQKSRNLLYIQILEHFIGRFQLFERLLYLL